MDGVMLHSGELHTNYIANNRLCKQLIIMVCYTYTYIINSNIDFPVSPQFNSKIYDRFPKNIPQSNTFVWFGYRDQFFLMTESVSSS